MAHVERHAMRYFALVIAIGWTLVFAAAVALAHDHPGPGDWIGKQRLADPETDLWCCNEKDCKPEPAGGITEVAGGYKVAKTGEVIPYHRVIWKSPDGRWWRCEEQWLLAKLGTTRCLIGPPPSI